MIEKEIRKIVESFGAKLYDTQSERLGDESIFRVLIMVDGGVTVDICEKISRVLSPFFDTNPPVRGAYYLEVSSPGVERKLERPEHFAFSIGEPLKLKLLDSTKLSGTLISSDSNGIVVKIGDSEMSLPYSQIIKAKTYFEWKK